MEFLEANDFLRQTGPVSSSLLDACTGLASAPAGFERIWAAFEPMDLMQKRGQIARPHTGEIWQLLCDEGAGLGGTDWAPPPLAYFAAGLASSVTGSIVEQLADRSIAAEAVTVALDNNYSLRGSLLRGTMEGKGHDADVAVAIEVDRLSSKDRLSLVLQALSGGLAGYLMKSVFASEFGLVANGASVPLNLPECQLDVDASVLPTMPLEPSEEPIVGKAFLQPENTPFEAGTGVGADAVQDRQIKVSAVARPGHGGSIKTQAGIGRPHASVYDIRGAHDAGASDAPSSACLIAAGIGFCFMTQLGRYAEAMKRSVEDYRMIQAIDIPLLGADGSHTPVIGTKLFLNQDRADPDFARDLAHSAKHTCFLHSTLQTSLRCRITAR